MPQVSIIIPNYNHSIFLEQRLDSVFNQTFQDFEVILLDDASTDHSTEILKSYETHPKVSHFIQNKINSGSPFVQWKKGIELAKGHYIWIAESDDYSDKNFLEVCLEPLIKGSGISYVQSLDVNSKGVPISSRINYTKVFNPNIWKGNFTLTGHDFIERYLIIKNVIPNASAVVFKKDLVNDLFFNEHLLNMKMCGDWFFWLQVVKNSNISFTNQNLNYFRHHNLVSRNHATHQKKRLRIIEESIIRHHFKTKVGIKNAEANKLLSIKWFRLHKITDIFKISFYSISYSIYEKFLLGFQFINYKIIN